MHKRSTIVMMIDLTHTIKSEMSVYPETPLPEFSPLAEIGHDGYRETVLRMGSHTGTHMDAPSHMLAGGASLDQLPVSRFCGKAVLLDVTDLPAGSTVTTQLLLERLGNLRGTDFLLLRTGWEDKWATPAFLDEPFPVLDEDAARYLVSQGLKGVGTDAISVDPVHTTTYPVHHVLFRAGLVSVECLCLNDLAGQKDIRFFALPLKYAKADGAPVRAMAEIPDVPEKELMRG